MKTAYAVFKRLAEKCVECGVEPESFAIEKIAELEERKIILATPSLRWYQLNAPRCAERICKALSRPLTDKEKFHHLGLVARIKRRLQPEPRQVENEVGLKQLLLTESGGRCKICGLPLDINNVVDDHIVPLAEGGSNHTSNLRATCAPCNLGKRDYYENTAMAAARPWWEPRQNIVSDSVQLTATKRYCVLVRDKSTCRICGAAAKAVSLVVTMRLKESEGGQPVYDNLITACESCVSHRKG